jgi:tight adherence protein B
MELPLISFLIVTFGFLAGTFLIPRFSRPDQRIIQQRLKEGFAAKASDTADPELFRNLDAMDFDLVEEYALLNDDRSLRAPRCSWRKQLDQLLETTRIPLTSGQFVGLAVSLALLLCLPGFWLLRWAGGALGLFTGAIAPFAFLQIRRTIHRERYRRQLPGAFELMARVIRAGQSVPQALQAVSDTFDDPLAGEFAASLHQQNLGLRPEVVFTEMASRSDIVEMRIFAMAMVIQRQTGGSLAEVLERLATLVRNRLRLRRHVRALTAEGRLQGITLAVLPFVMFGAMYFLNRKYAQVLLEHRSLLLATGACMAIGILWIRRIVNFET